jgi:hypothetical protein
MMVIVVLHSIDFLANAMPNPVYFVAAGGLATLALAIRYSNVAAQHQRRAPWGGRILGDVEVKELPC